MVAYALQPTTGRRPRRERPPEYGPFDDAPDHADSPVPDPFDDADALDELGDEIATLAAHISAACHRLLMMIADFDRRGGLGAGRPQEVALIGCTCASRSTWAPPGEGEDRPGAGRAPQTSASMARGELSFSQVRALTRVATPDNEHDLLELARGCTTAQLERMVRGWKRGSRQEEVDLERLRHESRTFSIFPDLDGMYVVRGKLPPEVGVLLMRTIEAASDQIYQELRAVPQLETEKAAAQRRADALALLAERAMATGFGGEDAPISGTRAERYQVVLHVDAETLSEDGEMGRSELEDGTRVSPEASRRLSCDAGLVRMGHAPDGQILSVGRKTRTISPALRRALEARDRGCRFPDHSPSASGARGLRFTDAHHVVHWSEGGETSLSNCLCLCNFHHRMVHEGGWKVDWWGEGRPVFFGPRGETHFEGRWQPPELPEDAVEALLEENRRCGVQPDWRTAGVRWKREADIPDRVYFAASEALE